MSGIEVLWMLLWGGIEKETTDNFQRQTVEEAFSKDGIFECSLKDEENLRS